ncbi:hypothetical protein LX32DRAFT_605011 [Colletotrichum zoysiae]|uniref:Uncharacterized protein n=1 Tax=Colletotrichum zoysiae TaxID=1216348 RepID=A0AAD9H3S1_9PEZI|nr:hypothetical protein LX32DRAFT_605011 [Colletotrichum zoysiae]
MDSYDNDSLFGSPLTTPMWQPTGGAPRDDIPLVLPGMGFNPSSVTNLATFMSSSTTQDQSAMPTSLQDAREAPARASDFESIFTSTSVHPLADQQAPRETNQSRPSAYSAQTLEAFRNTTSPIRLVPTVPTGTPSIPLPLPAVTSTWLPNHSSFQQTGYLAPPTTAAALPHGSIAGNNNATASDRAAERTKWCYKCRKDRPLSDYLHMTPMGQHVIRNTCFGCREKKRISAARSKIKKEETQVPNRLQAKYSQQPQHLHNQQQHQHEQHQQHDQQQQQTSGGFDGVATQTNRLPTLSLMTPAFPSLSFDNSLAGAQLIRDLQMFESDMADAANQVSSQLPSPSSVLPPDPTSESSTSQDQQQQETNSHPLFIPVQILPTTLSEADIDLLISQEAEKFRHGCRNCSWLKKQDAATVKKLWRRRVSTIVLGLVQVPPPDPQPRIGFVHSEGSHNLLPDHEYGYQIEN